MVAVNVGYTWIFARAIVLDVHMYVFVVDLVTLRVYVHLHICSLRLCVCSSEHIPPKWNYISLTQPAAQMSDSIKLIDKVRLLMPPATTMTQQPTRKENAHPSSFFHLIVVVVDASMSRSVACRLPAARRRCIIGNYVNPDNINTLAD